MKQLAFLLVIGFVAIACSRKEKSTPVEAKVLQDSEKKIVLFFGNSLTIGYLLEPDQAYPQIIQGYIDSLGYHYQVINSSVTDETTEEGKRRLFSVLKDYTIDIFVLALGSNDGLDGRDIPVIKNNLEEMVEMIKSSGVEKIILIGLEVPSSAGRSVNYMNDFVKMYADIASEKDLVFVPFLLEGVSGNASLNLEDMIHPNEKGHQVIAKNVWTVLEKEMTK